ncbi:MAG TPA: hypothetical protein VFE28_14685 [Candidatus Krumholzibacteria bacterium]|jgi:hypothetical protein|nr:hypothetical protein [Candidatus Krumholzibacteria bacterium]
MKKWIVIAVVMLAGAAQAQSQYQTAFEVGVGYTRPGAGGFDMVTLLMQGDDYLVETGVGLKADGETQFSWLIRGALRPAMAGNTILHVGAEYSLHTNSAVEAGELTSLSTVGLLFGASHPLTDHLNFEVHIFPLVFEFGGDDTVTRFLTAQLGAHILF